MDNRDTFETWWARQNFTGQVAFEAARQSWQAARASQWRPMWQWNESIGLHVLGISELPYDTVAKFFKHDDGWSMATFNGSIIRRTPTHFMPLPQPPENV